MEIETTKAERDIIKHALGLTREQKPYRNYYCTHIDDQYLLRLVVKGLMVPGRLLNGGNDRYFHVMEAGAQEVGATLKDIKN